jgi:predicted NAD/FAD-dependent oxidoreductase
MVITGEAFSPGGGVESAWLAGNACARRLIEED